MPENNKCLECLTKGEAVTLKEHINERFKSMESAIVDQRRYSDEKFRDYPGRFAPIEEHRILSADLKAIMEWKQHAEGMATNKSLQVVRWIAVASLVISLIELLRSIGITPF